MWAIITAGFSGLTQARSCSSSQASQFSTGSVVRSSASSAKVSEYNDDDTSVRSPLNAVSHISRRKDIAIDATALDTAPITPTGYPDTLGDEQAIDLGTVGYVQLRRKAEVRNPASSSLRSPERSLTDKHKVRLLEAAAKLVGGNIAESVRNADKEMKKHWAQVYDTSQSGRSSAAT